MITFGMEKEQVHSTQKYYAIQKVENIFAYMQPKLLTAKLAPNLWQGETSHSFIQHKILTLIWSPKITFESEFRTKENPNVSRL